MKISNSKKALAEIIKADGGWCSDECSYAVQDKSTWIIFGYENKPIRHAGDDAWADSKDCQHWIDNVPVLISNWHQTILSKDEYFHLYPVADDGWIEWDGGDNPPLQKGSIIDIVFRDGTIACELNAKDLRWNHHDSVSDIIAYRLHKPEVKPEFCKSVTRSIPEPELEEIAELNVAEYKRSIEELAVDYRNKLDYANRKQQEADDAKTVADSALGELERAGEEIGLIITIAKPNPNPNHELVITDWRDLQPMDEIKCTQVNTCGFDYADHIIGTIGVVLETDEPAKSGQAVKALFGHDEFWISGWEFIRRP